MTLTKTDASIGVLENGCTNHSSINQITPDRKIKVFISSKCGDNGKYDNLRARLKESIERLGFASVYTFEGTDPSTLTAGAHYTLALETCDVCIFLIDNKDGVTSGVQAEIDTVKRCAIKSIFYFCDEHEKKMTPLEMSLRGANYAKSKTVHSFENLSQDTIRALVNDIINIYLFYCQGKLILASKGDETDVHATELGISKNQISLSIPKEIIKNTDKCKAYILGLVTESSMWISEGEITDTSEIDDWAERFLSVMFEGKSIKDFNTSMLLETLKQKQDEDFHNIVKLRWKAIQAYFLDDIQECIEDLYRALSLAKESNQPAWVIQDILIDIRNQEINSNEINNNIAELPAQKELNSNTESIYYPVIDRIHNSLYKKYLKGFYDKKAISPNTITYGNDFSVFGSLLASSYVISVYNGSLTQMLVFYDRIKDFLFYLCTKYSKWKYREELLKITIFLGNTKDIKGIVNSYPEVLNEMTSKAAREIMTFCNNHPIAYQRFRSQLLAFGTIGYYLDDKEYNKIEREIITTITTWLNKSDSVFIIRQYIFKCLSNVSLRIPQNTLAEICCMFMDKHYIRWYIDMFKFMSNSIDLNKMEKNTAENLIHHIMTVLDNENERREVRNVPRFLCVFRNQNRILTEDLDKKVRKTLPDFYSDVYSLETTIESQEIFEDYLRKCIKRINESNRTQGKNGCYFVHGELDIATARNLLLHSIHGYDEEIMDAIIRAVTDTLLMSKEGIEIKLDAISLLICIANRYPKDFKRNQKYYNKVLASKESIEDIDNTVMTSNTGKVSLRLALALLETVSGKDNYFDFVEALSYIQSDKATILSVEKVIMECLETDEAVVLPQMISAIIMQNVLQWLQLDSLDIKYKATRILLLLSRDQSNEEIVNQRIISLVNEEGVYIKKHIMLQMLNTKGIQYQTIQYVLEKCQNDPCYVVRMVCKEVRDTML